MAICETCGEKVRYIESLKVFQSQCDNCSEEQLRKNFYIINSFTNKLKRIGIKVELGMNVPWVYLESVQGISVKERYMAEHGFTAFFTGFRWGENSKFSDIKLVFGKVREMLENPEEDLKKFKNDLDYGY